MPANPPEPWAALPAPSEPAAPAGPSAPADLPAIKEALAAYPLTLPVSLDFLGRGKRSAAWLVASAEPRQVLKLYAAEDHTRPQIEREIALLRFLRDRGFPTVGTVPGRDGAHLTPLRSAGDARYAVLFNCAAGEVVDRLDAHQAHLVGTVLARFHNHGDDPGCPPAAVSLKHARPSRRLDTQNANLSVKAVTEAIAAANTAPNEIRRELPGLAAEARQLAARLRTLRSGLRQGLCHGSFHFGNFALEGDAVTVFDLEGCCRGVTVYDLGMLLCSIAESTRRGQEPKEASRAGQAAVAGYESVRPLSRQERQALLLYLPVASLNILARMLRPVGHPDASAFQRLLAERQAWPQLTASLGWNEWRRDAHAASPLAEEARNWRQDAASSAQRPATLSVLRSERRRGQTAATSPPQQPSTQPASAGSRKRRRNR